MTYVKRVWSTGHPKEGVSISAKEIGDIDNALFAQDARITALEVAVADLLARVIVLEGP